MQRHVDQSPFFIFLNYFWILGYFSGLNNFHLLCCSVAKSFPTLCNSMHCRTPGFPVFHHLLEFAQTHFHQVGDAIQPSCPLLSPSFLPSIFLSVRVFSNESALCIRWPNYWSFSFSIRPSSKYSGLISFRTDSFASIYTCYCRK